MSKLGPSTEIACSETGSDGLRTAEAAPAGTVLDEEVAAMVMVVAVRMAKLLASIHDPFYRRSRATLVKLFLLRAHHRNVGDA